MKAVDTNVLARYIVQDDPKQGARAEAVLDGGAFVPLTVLLETAWLLRSRYGMARKSVAEAINVVLSLATVEVVDVELVRWALDRAVAGADIADMLHLVAARHRTAFVTFDVGIEASAGRDGPVLVETLG